MNAGDDILVQVIKDPIGTKGARLTTFIALPSRYLVYMPRGAGDRRVGAHRGRGRARAPEGAASTQLARQQPAAATSCAPRRRAPSPRACARTWRTSRKLWEHVRARAAQARAGTVVHEDLPLALRVLRDELARGVSRVLVDSAREHARMQRVRRRLHARRPRR